MELKDAITTRRSIRKYKQQEVAKEDIYKIIEAGTYAPSAHFREPWRVMILKDAEKDIVASIMTRYVEKSNTSDISIEKTANTIINANTLLLVFNTSKEDLIMDTLSIGAMIENMCLTATDMGISSLWIGNHLYVKEEIKKHYKIEEELDLVGGLLLGYSEQEPRELPRKKVEEIIINTKK